MVLIKRLIERGTLTKFQAQLIIQGKTHGLAFGEYIVLDRIGAGGMGQVFKARHRRMDRLVALKVMASAAMKDLEAVKRFQREAKAAAKLNHPNIVTAYDAGENAGVHFLVMEFVDGHDLSGYIKEHGPFPFYKRSTPSCKRRADWRSLMPRESFIAISSRPISCVTRKVSCGCSTWAWPDSMTRWAKAKTTASPAAVRSWGRSTTWPPSKRSILATLVPRPMFIAWVARCIACSPVNRFTTARRSCKRFWPTASKPFRRCRRGHKRFPPRSKNCTNAWSPRSWEDRPTMVEIVQELERIARGELSAKIVVHTRKTGTGDRPASPGRNGKRASAKWLAAAAAGFLFIAFGVWVIVKDKDGNEIARFKAPEGSIVTMQSDTAITPSKAPTPTAVPTSTGKSAVSVPSFSNLDNNSKQVAAAVIPIGSPLPKPAIVPLDLKPLPNEVKPGMALGSSAIVQHPVTIPGVRAWTIVTRTPRGKTSVIAGDPDHKWFATGGEGAGLRIWETTTGKLVKILFPPIQDNGYFVDWLDWSPTDRYLAVSYRTGDAQLGNKTWRPQNITMFWDVVAGQVVYRSESEMTPTWSSDGRYVVLAKGGNNPQFKIVDLATNSSTLVTTPANLNTYGFAWHPNDGRLASAHADGTLRIWQVGKQEPIHVLFPEGKPQLATYSGIDWSPTGRQSPQLHTTCLKKSCSGMRRQGRHGCRRSKGYMRHDYIFRLMVDVSSVGRGQLMISHNDSSSTWVATNRCRVSGPRRPICYRAELGEWSISYPPGENHSKSLAPTVRAIASVGPRMEAGLQ